MPIVFVHGAGTREHYRRYRLDMRHVLMHLQHYIAPVIAPDPENVAVITAYWGDVGVRLAWDGASVPPPPRLSVQNHPLMTLLPVGRKRHIVREVGRRIVALLGYLLARAAATLRRPRTNLTAIFLGDALHYFATRGTAAQPGPIPLHVLATLTRARAYQQARPGEPLVVLTHSLGGTIVYDIVTHFLPNMPAYTDMRIDFWASVSSQIGMFEEMKLFLASDSRYGPHNPVPFPDRRFLGAWWNVWDPHDFLSFSVRNIIADVDDTFFDSGLTLSTAHMACLKISSFYTLLAQKLAIALGRTSYAPTRPYQWRAL